MVNFDISTKNHRYSKPFFAELCVSSALFAFHLFISVAPREIPETQNVNLKDDMGYDVIKRALPA